jgi:hypothetical protein
MLERTIKESGEFAVEVRLHPEVHTKLKVTIVAKGPAAGDASDDDSRPRGRRAPRQDSPAEES